MKKTINRLLPILFAGMFFYAGCAKQEVVKNDEPLVPAVTKSTAASAQKTVVSEQKLPNNPTDTAVINSSALNGNEQKNSPRENESATIAALQKSLQIIFFDFDSAALSNAARQALTRNFDVLRQNPQSRMRIEGHCDERGSDEYNLALGEQRAQAAARYLTTLGISGERLSTISFGKEKPADPGHDENAWAKNRRDEFIITSR